MCLYKRIVNIVTPIHLRIIEVNYEHVWSKGVYVKGLLTYLYIHTHETCPLCMYDNLVNRGSLERCSQGYPKLDGASICYVHVKYFLT